MIGIHLHLGKTKLTEICEPYVMLTNISWFTALRKKVQFLRLGQFLSKKDRRFILSIHLSPWPSNHKLFFVTAIKIYH